LTERERHQTENAKERKRERSTEGSTRRHGGTEKD
jgi:hypothetical protein